MFSYIFVAWSLLQIANAIKTGFTFQSQGETVVADLYLPENAKGPIPITVAGPGFPSVKEIFYPAYGEALASNGIAALIFDYPGFGSSPISAGKVRQDVIIDQQHGVYTDSINVVSKDARFDSNRIGVLGKSLSGAHAIFMAATDKRVKAGVSVVPHIGASDSVVQSRLQFMDDISADLTAKSNGEKRVMVKAYGKPGDKAVMTTDGAFDYISRHGKGTTYVNEVTASSLLEIAGYDVYEESKAIAIPHLVLSGLDDTITPNKNVHKALDGNKIVEIHDYPGGHFTSTEINEPVFLNLTVGWFKKHL